MRRGLCIALLCAGLLFTGCSAGSMGRAAKTDAETDGDGIGEESSGSDMEYMDTETDIAETDAGTDDTAAETGASDGDAQDEPSGILKFVDVFGEEYQVEILPDVEKHTYQMDAFIHDGDRLSYEDEQYSCRLGVDVSHHQGEIDWQAVRDAGYTFAFLRIGFRGYGTAGAIRPDTQFERNITQAQAAGLDVGVYFFSQAVNEEEAREEAEFVLGRLQGYELQLPVVFDPENILDDDARTDDVTGEQFTKNTIVFCNLIKEAGYEPMIYSNMLWEAFQFDLRQLSGYPVWYADYEQKPQTPYQFEFWQYSNTGNVAGISGETDLDIQLIKKP